jgi:hypothetical protein
MLSMVKDRQGPNMRDIEASFQRRVIAGIRPVAISDKPYYKYPHNRKKSIAKLETRHYLRGEKKANNRIEPPAMNLAAESAMELPTLLLYRTHEPTSDTPLPMQTFYLDGPLLRAIKRKSGEKGKDPTETELLHLALASTEGSVRPDFSQDAMNDINASYFASPLAFSSEAGLATLFVTNRPINRAMGRLIASINKETIRIKELSSGRRAESWQYIAEGVGNRTMDVEVTDFVTPKLPADLSLPPYVTLRSGQHSLFEEFPALEARDKVDVMTATYGFDSVWLPGDIRVTKRGDTWYRFVHRVKVSEWHPRREELLQALQERKPLSNATVADYDGIFVEEAIEEIDITSHPFGEYLQAHLAGKKTGTITFPGGLIKTVIDAFDKQIDENGMMIIADVATNEVRSSYVSGIAARYKTDNYEIAKRILEDEYGFDVEISTLEAFTTRQLGPDWQKEAKDTEISGIKEDQETTYGTKYKNINYVMKIKKRKE